jgi:hypothetical protein
VTTVTDQLWFRCYRRHVEAAVWSAIALVGALSTGTLFVLVGRIDGLAARMDARLDGLADRIDSLSARIDGRLDGLSTRITLGSTGSPRGSMVCLRR